jgi:small subunit ribosomal protein S20
MVKEAIKAVRAVTTFDEAWEKFKTATKVLDKVAAKGIMHKNTAANQKSGLAKYVNSLKPATN